MACEHKHLRCTDGVFYCLDCGQRVEAPKPKETVPEPEKPKRRTARKGATK